MVRTRFAPSPTGYLHIGGLRTALYAYLFAKKNNGKFVLRIEDTDIERYVEGAVEIIYNTLRSSGLNYDEGPDVGGEYGSYIQSERKQLYLPLAEELVARGGAYYCFCSKERIEKIHADGATKYDKCCLSIPLAEAKKRVASGESYCIRQNIPSEGVSKYNDLVFGEIAVDYKDLEDNILIKSDGMPTYNFANVVDDHLMNINYVIRGTEYLSSTPKYNLLYESFGWEKPQYIHTQPIMKDATRKLSKRHGDASYDDFIFKGYLKEAIINYIALLGWSPKENREKFTLEEMVELFSIKGLSKSASIFDENKLKWLNSLYIKELSPEQFHEFALPFYAQCDYLAGFDLAYLSTLLQSRAEIISDVIKLSEFISLFDGFDLELFAHAKMKTNVELAKQFLPRILSTVRSCNWADLHDSLVNLATELGVKNGQILWIFRIAITGSASTPGGATEMAQLLGRERVLDRLQAVLLRL